MREFLLTPRQIARLEAFAEDSRLKRRTRTLLYLLIFCLAMDMHDKDQSKAKDRRLVNEAMCSRDPVAFILRRTLDGPFRQRRLMLHLRKLPVSTMTLKRVARALGCAKAEARSLLQIQNKITRGITARLSRIPRATVAALYLSPVAKLAVIRVQGRPDITADYLFRDTSSFAIAQAGPHNSDLVVFQARWASLAAQLPPFGLVIPKGQDPEPFFLKHLESALAVKPLDPVPDDVRTFCVLEYSGRDQYRSAFEDVVAERVTREFDLVRNDIFFRVEEVMTRPGLISQGAGYFPDLQGWCAALKNAKPERMGWLRGGARALKPFWETSGDHQFCLWDRTYARRTAEKHHIRLFSASGSRREDGNIAVFPQISERDAGIPRGIEISGADTARGTVLADGMIQVDDEWMFLNTSWIHHDLIHRLCDSRFADEIQRVRPLLPDTEKNVLGLNTFLDWFTHPHQTRKSLMRAVKGSNLLKRLAAGIALTQFAEEFLVGSSPADIKGRFAQGLSRLGDAVCECLGNALRGQHSGSDHSMSPLAASEARLASFSKIKAYHFPLTVLRLARGAFLDAMGHEASKAIYNEGLLLVIQGRVPVSIIPSESPLYSFWPRTVRIRLTALIDEFHGAGEFCHERRLDDLSLDKPLGEDGHGSLYDTIPQEAPAEVEISPEEFLQHMDEIPDKETWRPPEYIRRVFTNMAIRCLGQMGGAVPEIREFIEELPKIIRVEVKYQLSRIRRGQTKSSSTNCT